MAKKKTQQSYPVLNNNGQVFNSPVYQDDNGNAYTVDDNGNAWYVERQNTFDNPIQLDDVNVYAPSPQYMLDNALSQYSTLSNDRNKVLNTPHRQYNTHLNDNAQRGAVSHNTWTKEHPNLDSWSYVPSAAVMATAAYPMVAGAGSAILSTGAGQAARYGLSKLMRHPISTLADHALGWYGSLHGLDDIHHGKFTPMTALDLAGFEPLLNSSLRSAYWLDTGSFPNRGKFYDAIGSWMNKGKASKMEEASERLVREAQSVEDVPSHLPSSYQDEVPEINPIYQRAQSSENIRPIIQQPIEDTSTLSSSTSFASDARSPLTPPPSTVSVDIPESSAANIVADAALNPSPAPSRSSFKVRNLYEGNQPYTEEEVRNAFFNEDGSFIGANNLPADVTRVNTGAHGFFYQNDPPEEVLRHHLFDTQANREELRQIRRDNPKGRSGVILHTHHNDLSADSAPLAYSIGMTQGEHFMPFPTATPTVYSNSLGYNNFFKESREIADRAREYYRKHPDAKDVELLKDDLGNMTSFKITDENGEFFIPLRNEEEYLEIPNKRIDAFNNKFHTSYPHVTPREGLFGNPDTPEPWYFGKQFNLPNIFGVAYEKGGKVKKRKNKLISQL